MTDTIRVYVDGTGMSVPAGASVLEAVRLRDPALADAIVAGTRSITDSRGLPAAPASPVYGGAIYRVVAATAASRALPADDVPPA